VTAPPQKQAKTDLLESTVKLDPPTFAQLMEKKHHQDQDLMPFAPTEENAWIWWNQESRKYPSGQPV
jgi:hypothetical protein